MRHTTKTFLSIVAPIVFLPLLQLGGCARTVDPPPPGGVYLSESAGASFDQSVNIEGKEGEYIARFDLQTIHRPAHNPSKVYVAAGEQGIVVSENDGETWRQIPTPLSSTGDVIELENNVLIAAGIGSNGQGFILRSLDGGQGWQTVLTIPVPEEEKKRFEIVGRNRSQASVVIAIEPDPFNSDRIFAGTNLGSVFVGEQSAKIWRTLYTLSSERSRSTQDQQEQFGIRAIFPSPHKADELLLITGERALWRVNADEQVEIAIKQDLEDTRRFGGGKNRRVFDVAYIPGFPSALLIGVEDGAVTTRDGGATFTELPLPVETIETFNTVDVAVSPTNINRMLVAINEVIYRSEDAGKTWNTHSLRLPQFVITALSINPANAARVLLVAIPLET